MGQRSHSCSEMSPEAWNWAEELHPPTQMLLCVLAPCPGGQIQTLCWAISPPHWNSSWSASLKMSCKLGCPGPRLARQMHKVDHTCKHMVPPRVSQIVWLFRKQRFKVISDNRLATFPLESSSFRRGLDFSPFCLALLYLDQGVLPLCSFICKLGVKTLPVSQQGAWARREEGRVEFCRVGQDNSVC